MKIATVCSGIGSPEVALKNLKIDHEISFACEIDKFARQTYLANHNPLLMLEDMTIESWEGKEFYSDLFIGGIPCQSFSLAGKRLGELDPRGLLFFDFLRYVKIQNPKYFIIENVKGLLSSKSCITYRNTLYLLLHNFNKITKWEQLNSDQNSLNLLSQNISNYLLLNFAKKLNLQTDKSGTYLNIKQGLSYEKLEQRAGSGLKRRLKFLEERIYQITKKYNYCQKERIQQLEEQEADLDLLQDQLYLIENLIPLVTNLLEKTVDIDVNTQLFSNNLLEENLKTGKLYTTLTELNSITDSKTFFYVLESNIIRLIILALDLSPNLWKEIWLILTKKKEFIGLKTFDIWTSNLSNLLYNLHWQVLNTKDYGLPQNRERVFLIGIRNDLPNDFNFPKTIPLKLRLKDILEDEVDEKYYLSEKMINYLTTRKDNFNGGKINFKGENDIASCINASSKSLDISDNIIQVGNVNPSGNGMNGNVFSDEGLCPTLTTNKGEGIKIQIKSATKSGYETATEGDSINLEHPDSQTRRGRVGKQVAQTLTTSCNQGVMIGAMRGRTVKIAKIGRSEEGKKQRKESLAKGVDYTPFQAKEIKFEESDVMNCITTATTKDNLIQVSEYQQDLEINENGTSNCLTSVQKDNLVIQINPSLESGGKQPYQQNRVYDGKGIAPALCRGKSDLNVTYNNPKVKHNLSGGKWDKMHEQSRRVYDENGIAPTIHTMGGGNQEIKTFDQYRIRKLTPKECFRLQGFPDEFLQNAIDAGVSNSQLYKQAGNSISVPVIQSILKILLKNEI